MYKTLKILIVIADGTEEIEAVVPIDLFRRAGFDVSVAGEKHIVVCSRGTKIVSDLLLNEVDYNEIYDLIFIPGGSKGTENLLKNQKLELLLQKQIMSNRYVAAICAAPTILSAKRLVGKDVSITSHPSVRDNFQDLNYVEQDTVISGKMITSRGAGTAIDMALKIIEIFRGKELARRIANDIVYSYYE